MGLQDLKNSIKNVFTFENVIFLLVISLVVMHVGSILLVKMFHIGIQYETLNQTMACTATTGCATGFACNSEGTACEKQEMLACDAATATKYNLVQKACDTDNGYVCSGPKGGDMFCTQSKLLTNFIPGPYVLFLLAIAVVTFVFALIRRTYHEILINRQSLALILVVAAIIVAVFLYFEKLAPQLFQPAVAQARAAFGILRP